MPSPDVSVNPETVLALLPAVGEGELPTRRDLLLQALLHLPRIADAGGTVAAAQAVDEIERLRARRAAEFAPLAALAEAPAAAPRLQDLEVRTVERAHAAPILDHFHYLRSARRDSLTIGALHDGRVAALCCFSPLDLPAVADRLPVDRPTEAMVVSRVFAFDWAPRNVVSYTLARAAAILGETRPDVRLLLTYLNPNMGFSGASYRSANWVPLGIETGTRYAYLDERYVTDRELVRLPPSDRARVEFSKMPLRPLVLLCRLLDRRLRRAHPGGFDFVWQRPELEAEPG